MNKGIMSICFSVCNYNAASPLWKFMPRKGFFFFLLVECITFGKELMAICKCGDGWKFCYTCCNKNGLLGYQMQEWKPKLQPPLGLLTQDPTCISIFWAIPKDLCFLVKWVPFEMLVLGHRDSALGAPGF